MLSTMLILRIFLGVLFTYWLLASIQFTVIPHLFRPLKKAEFYLAIAFGTVIYIYIPPLWFILVLGLYLYHFKIRSKK
ncbi:hypothetical protein SAMN06296008_10758 [Polynucleobacter kasalickyi]|uniref:Uncharacterized protein n=1 Tax=Polynucleobacter kasalickyi TaxID=1938817 RepID=A0A1W2A3F3_9BURK|nr:hypothetical protein SAMN06296008_10758 [Polynucleobacter kasalickyi]